jgi:hypothetical protein
MQITLESWCDSFIGVLGVDQSVLILKNGNNDLPTINNF